MPIKFILVAQCETQKEVFMISYKISALLKKLLILNGNIIIKK